MPSIGGKGSPPLREAPAPSRLGRSQAAFRAGLRPPKTRPRDEKRGSSSPLPPPPRGFRTTASPAPLAGRPGAAAGGRARPWLTALRRPRGGEKQPRSGGRPAGGDGGTSRVDRSSEPRESLPSGSDRATSTRFRLRPQIRRDDPLNLSILLSGGKETNQDSLSSGERRGKSPAPNPRQTGGRGKCGV